jgi:hypothetical protein
VKKVVNKNKNLISAVVVAMMVAALLLQGCTTAGPAALAKSEPVMVSGLKCTENGIEGTITNIISQDVDVNNLRVLLDGEVVDSKMMKCDKAVLKPGQSTDCQSLQGILPVEGENNIAVVMGSESSKASITC